MKSVPFIKVEEQYQENVIEPDSEQGIKWEFTSDKFDGYLWQKPNEVWISVIVSKDEGKGNMKKLFENIEKEGLKIAVPTPSVRMRTILTKWGFQQTLEYDTMLQDTVEVWRKL